MLTRRIDEALEALILCRERLPRLCELCRPGGTERAALEALLDALRRAEQALAGGRGPP